MWQTLKNMVHLIEALCANVYYRWPSRELYVIGVTGTDGKTTTTSLIYQILKANGYRVAMITSVGAFIGSRIYDIGFHVTTPSSFAVQRYLRKAVDEGVEYVVLETTSHALDQNRVWGIRFALSVLTNITHEHLDYHKTYEKYIEAKTKLLTHSCSAIVNRDDASFSLVVPYLTDVYTTTYGIRQREAQLTPRTFPFTSPLLGEFNTYNVLAAIAAVRHVGVPDSGIRKALATCKAPKGRQEIVYDKEFSVMIDFAHTPGSFESVLPAIRKITKKHLIHVFGSAARRDVSKRPLMGKVSSEYADIIILTAEDPRGESIADICRDIQQGIGQDFMRIYPQKTARHEWFRATERWVDEEDLRCMKEKIESLARQEKKAVVLVPDRRQAIEFAICIAQRGDFVLLTGKGHEKSMNYGKGEESWDEYGVVREALEKREKTGKTKKINRRRS